MLWEEFDFIKYQKLSDWTLVEQFSNKECDFNFFFLSPKLRPVAIKNKLTFFLAVMLKHSDLACKTH